VISGLIPKWDFSFHSFLSTTQPPILLADVRGSFPMGRESDHSGAQVNNAWCFNPIALI
jgi:hypothetical protein